ncbi:uncharacterized protein LOC119733850, partial [Patiria miniata]|uniref:Uncharacterized protein n=1 Tax=Patiria miniata TaxID=46514 RepID=A0A914AGN1_PATMI
KCAFFSCHFAHVGGSTHPTDVQNAEDISGDSDQHSLHKGAETSESSDSDFIPDSSFSSGSEDAISLERVARPTGKRLPFGKHGCVQVAAFKQDGKRSWNKADYCLYCGNKQAKVARHCLVKHKDKNLVREIKALPLKSVERKQKITVLRNKGNLQHNFLVWESGSGEIVPRKRPAAEVAASEYLPCEFCQGSYKRDGLWKHQVECAKRNKMVRKHRSQSNAKMMIPDSSSGTASESLKTNVISRMVADDITQCVRSDADILLFGTKMIKSHPEPHQALPISQNMRDLAKVVVAAGSIDETVTSIRDLVNPQKFDLLVMAVKQVAGYCPVSNSYKTSSYARNVGYHLDKVVASLKSMAIKSEDQELQDRVEKFQELKRAEWTSEVVTLARHNLDSRKNNKPQRLPIASDIKKLTGCLKNTMHKHKVALQQNPTSNKDWTELCQSTLALVVLFNRRRTGETERLLLRSYKMAENNADIQPDVFQSLGEVEKVLVRKFTRIEVRGKRGRKVPVLLTKEMVENVDMLNATREAAGVSPNNKYVFGRAFCNSPFQAKASDCLRKYSSLCGAKHPKTLRSTKLSKHIATMSQLLSLKENVLDMLASYMGHDVRIRREFYRLPESTLQLAKVSKVLLMMEKGETSKYKGKSLDEIDVSLEDVDEDSESDHVVDGESLEETPESSTGTGTGTGTREFGEPFKPNDANAVAQDRETPESSTSTGFVREFGEPFKPNNANAVAQDRETPESSTSTGFVREFGEPFEPNNANAVAQDREIPESSTSTGFVREFGEPFKPNNANAVAQDRGSVGQQKKKRLCQPWTAIEKNFIATHFGQALDLGRSLRKAECVEAQDLHPELKKRKWSNIKDYVLAEAKRRRKDASHQ